MMKKASLIAMMLTSSAFVGCQPALATTVEVKANVDVVALMREFANWASSGMARWDDAKRRDIELALPRVAADLNELASEKEVLARDLTTLSGLLPDRSSVYGKTNASSAVKVRGLAERTQSEGSALSRTLTRLQAHIEAIDPRWAEKHLATHSAVSTVSEGYGTIILYVKEINQTLSDEQAVKSDIEPDQIRQLSAMLLDEAKHLKALAAEIAQTPRDAK